jgi:hypothetical protein
MAPARTELDAQRDRSTAYTLLAHLVFVTKHRRPVFTAQMLTSCEHLTADICPSLGGELRELDGETDHVHLLVQSPPPRGIDVGQPTQRRLAAPAPPALPNTGSEIPVGQALLVPVLLRRLLRRRTPDHHAIHRTTKLPGLTSKPPASPAAQLYPLPPGCKGTGFRRRRSL